MDDSKRIKEMLAEGRTSEVVELLEAFLATNAQDDEAYFLLGNAYRKMENWQMAMNSYRQAMEINPESPARLAYDMVVQILDFYNKDMFNQ